MPHNTLVQNPVIQLRNIRPQWQHPYLDIDPSAQQFLNPSQLNSFAHGYYLKFLPLFQNTEEGSLKGGIHIVLSRRLKSKLGTADLHERIVTLNQSYFQHTPHLLPYTLYHELTHLWLYDCDFDPNHTKRFYRKMQDFERSGLPIDKKVYLHKRMAPENPYIYKCPTCHYKWFLRTRLKNKSHCHNCKVEIIRYLPSIGLGITDKGLPL